MTQQGYPSMAQIDPSDFNGYAYYQIQDSTSSSILAEIVATNTGDSSSGMAARTEYWRITGSSFKTAPLGPLTVYRHKRKWSSDPPPYKLDKASFQVPIDNDWNQSNSVIAHAPIAHNGDNDDDNAFVVDVSYDSSTNVWKGTITFYRSTNHLAFVDIPDGSSREYRQTQRNSTPNKVLKVCQMPPQVIPR